tara:strand:- start:5437 stop:6123 length:687 start_codon:yes stop_codon:yes gene_type:complete
MMTPVRDIKLNNQEFIDILDEYKDKLMTIQDNGKPAIANKAQISNFEQKQEDWVSDDYMNKIMREGRAHDGFPAVLRGYTGLKWQDQEKLPMNKRAHEDICNASKDLNTKLISFISANNNALNAAYPPGGFISWHNNANAPGYNIICSWSETGDGWFDYWDLDKKERVRVQDQKGWNCKMTYFGSYMEPEKICYHAAYTNCYRITVAYVFKDADNFWEEVIEDLENPL